jgi:hypothetical protein
MCWLRNKSRNILPNVLSHCKKSVLKIQEYFHEGANLKFYIPEFFNFKLLIPEYSPIYRFWFQTAAYFFLQCIRKQKIQEHTRQLEIIMYSITGRRCSIKPGSITELRNDHLPGSREKKNNNSYLIISWLHPSPSHRDNILYATLQLFAIVYFLT